MDVALTIASLTTGGIVALAAGLSIVPRLGRIGRRVSAALCRAPGLDFVVAAFTILPWIVAGAFAGWRGFGGALLGQFVALYAWCFAHEMLHRDAARGPRIVKFHARTVGRWQNHLSL